MIYKPTSCEPLLLTFDATQTPFFLECQIDSANTKVDAYSIKLLNNENNEVVFGHDGDVFKTTVTLISDLKTYFDTNYASYGVGYTNLNTGLNGSSIKIPFIVAKGLQSTDDDDDDDDSVKYNQIYLDGDTFKKADDDNTVPIFNGVGYKWQITLYQLDQSDLKNKNIQAPSSLKYYDMSITNGVVMGSNNERIQSVVSDKILGDYYIQPVTISGLSFDNSNPGGWTSENTSEDDIQPAGDRVLIKSYDSTYGYIYPVKGTDGLTSINLSDDGANGFRIYKRGNSPDNLTQYQKVSWVLTENIKMKWVTTLTNISESYGTYTYNVAGTTKPTTYYVKAGDTEYPFGEGARIVLNNQGVIGDAYQSVYVSIAGSNQGNNPYSNSDKWRDTGLKLDEIPTFNNDTIYNQYDVVVYNNTKYISKKNGNKGHTPVNGTYWASASPTIDPWSGTTSYGQYALCNWKSTYILPSSVNSSPFNGIFYPTFSTNAIKDADDDSTTIGYQVTVKLMRTPDADTWGELINKIVYVENSSIGETISPFAAENIQPIESDTITTDQAFGTINETPVTFVKEKPIDIYEYTGDNAAIHNNTGIIFYNKIQTGNNKGIVYIRPFTGIQRDQVLILNSVTNTQNFIYLQTVNTDYWFVTYDKLREYNINTQSIGEIKDKDAYWKIDESRYAIKTFYRDSDENPFYFNTAPYIHVQITNADGTVFPGNNVKNYTSTATYAVGDIAWYKGQYFKYFGRTEDVQPEQAPVFNIPNYVASKSYNFGDIVYYDGTYYYCIQNTPVGALPTVETYWEKYQWQPYVITITGRSMNVFAHYEQNENIQWKMAQWFLYDANGSLVDSSDIIYDQNIEYQYDGLGGIAYKDYTLELVVETYQNYREVLQLGLKTNYVIERIDGKEIVDVSFDCDRMGVVSSMIAVSEFVGPDPDGGTKGDVEYNYNSSTEKGTMTVDGEVIYDGVTTDFNYLASQNSSPIRAHSGEFEIKLSSRIDTNSFMGDIVKVDTFVDTADGATPDHSDEARQSTIQIYAPDPIISENNYETWNKNETYGRGTVVVYNGVRYFSLVNDNTSKTPSASQSIGYWASLEMGNVWGGDITYTKGDIVIYNSIRYFSLVDSNVGKTPGTSESASYWAQIFTDETDETWTKYGTGRPKLIINTDKNKFYIRTNSVDQPIDLYMKSDGELGTLIDADQFIDWLESERINPGLKVFYTVSEWQPEFIEAYTSDELSNTNFLPLTYVSTIDDGSIEPFVQGIELSENDKIYFGLDYADDLATYLSNLTYTTDEIPAHVLVGAQNQSDPLFMAANYTDVLGETDPIYFLLVDGYPIFASRAINIGDVSVPAGFQIYDISDPNVRLINEDGTLNTSLGDITIGAVNDDPDTPEWNGIILGIVKSNNYLNVDNQFNVYGDTLLDIDSATTTIKHVQQGPVTRDMFTFDDTYVDADTFEALAFNTASEDIDYDATHTYNKYDVVLYSGNYYESTANNNLGHTPGGSGVTEWELLNDVTELFMIGPTPQIFSDLQYVIGGPIFVGADNNGNAYYLEKNVYKPTNGRLFTNLEEGQSYTSADLVPIFSDGTPAYNINLSDIELGEAFINNASVETSNAEIGPIEETLYCDSLLMQQIQLRDGNGDYINPERALLRNKVLNIDVPLVANNTESTIDIFDVQEYSSEVTYRIGDIVVYDNMQYISMVDNNRNHTPDAGSDYWDETYVSPIIYITNNFNDRG